MLYYGVPLIKRGDTIYGIGSETNFSVQIIGVGSRVRDAGPSVEDPDNDVDERPLAVGVEEGQERVLNKHAPHARVPVIVSIVGYSYPFAGFCRDSVQTLQDTKGKWNRATSLESALQRSYSFLTVIRPNLQSLFEFR